MFKKTIMCYILVILEKKYRNNKKNYYALRKMITANFHDRNTTNFMYLIVIDNK